MDEVGKKSNLTDQTSEMIGSVGLRSKSTDQTSGMLDYRYEKAKLLDQTLGMVGNRYQNIKTCKIVRKFSKILYVLNYFNTWKIFKSIFSNFQSPKFQNNTRPNLHIGFSKIVKNFFLGKSLASLGIFIAMYWITRGGGAIFLRASRSKNCARTLPSHISWR